MAGVCHIFKPAEAQTFISVTYIPPSTTRERMRASRPAWCRFTASCVSTTLRPLQPTFVNRAMDGRENSWRWESRGLSSHRAPQRAEDTSRENKHSHVLQSGWTGSSSLRTRSPWPLCWGTPPPPGCTCSPWTGIPHVPPSWQQICSILNEAMQKCYLVQQHFWPLMTS